MSKEFHMMRLDITIINQIDFQLRLLWKREGISEPKDLIERGGLRKLATEIKRMETFSKLSFILMEN